MELISVIDESRAALQISSTTNLPFTNSLIFSKTFAAAKTPKAKLVISKKSIHSDNNADQVMKAV